MTGRNVLQGSVTICKCLDFQFEGGASTEHIMVSDGACEDIHWVKEAYYVYTGSRQL